MPSVDTDPRISGPPASVRRPGPQALPAVHGNADARESVHIHKIAQPRAAPRRRPESVKWNREYRAAEPATRCGEEPEPSHGTGNVSHGVGVSMKRRSFGVTRDPHHQHHGAARHPRTGAPEAPLHRNSQTHLTTHSKTS